MQKRSLTERLRLEIVVCVSKSLADKCFIRGNCESSGNFSVMEKEIAELEK